MTGHPRGPRHNLIGPAGTRLPGNWRRTQGSKAHAHLFSLNGEPAARVLAGYADAFPVCGKQVPSRWTVRAPDSAVPCARCLGARPADQQPVPARPRRLAQRTQLGPWSRGQSDEAACEDDECGWSEGPGKARVIEYAARRHVVDTGHNVEHWRTFTRLVFLADDEPAR